MGIPRRINRRGILSDVARLQRAEHRPDVQILNHNKIRAHRETCTPTGIPRLCIHMQPLYI
nr:MAG TPA: hypothetical protein [Caudoviricetes sp.]